MCGSRRRRTRSGLRVPHLGHHLLRGHHGVVHTVRTPNEKLSLEGVYCFSCNFKENDSNATYCQNCGERIHTCPISQMPFKLGDEFGQCPSCKTIFHLHHLEMAMERSNKCPYCQTSLMGISVGKVGKHAVSIEK